MEQPTTTPTNDDSWEAELAKHDPETPFTLDLRKPVTFLKKDYASLTFQPANGMAQRQMQARFEKASGQVIIRYDDIMRAGACMAGVPDGVFDLLVGRDLGRAIKVTNHFLEPLQ